MTYWLLKAVLSPIFFVLFRVKVEGRENIPKHGPAVLAANHQSFCDSFFIPLVVRRKVTFLAKAEYFDSWKTAWFFRAAGQIPIRRGGGKASDRALETARADVLGEGHLLGLYPEGTRTLDQYVHKGRTGVTRLSRECGVPVIPVGVIGTVDVQPVNSNFMRPFKTVRIRFGAADADGPAGEPRRPAGPRPHQVPGLHQRTDEGDRPSVRARVRRRVRALALERCSVLNESAAQGIRQQFETISSH